MNPTTVIGIAVLLNALAVVFLAGALARMQFRIKVLEVRHEVLNQRTLKLDEQQPSQSAKSWRTP